MLLTYFLLPVGVPRYVWLSSEDLPQFVLGVFFLTCSVSMIGQNRSPEFLSALESPIFPVRDSLVAVPDVHLMLLGYSPAQGGG